jgi:hypothetical protein
LKRTTYLARGILLSPEMPPDLSLQRESKRLHPPPLGLGLQR